MRFSTSKSIPICTTAARCRFTSLVLLQLAVAREHYKCLRRIVSTSYDFIPLLNRRGMKSYEVSTSLRSYYCSSLSLAKTLMSSLTLAALPPPSALSLRPRLLGCEGGRGASEARTSLESLRRRSGYAWRRACTASGGLIPPAATVEKRTHE
jgi:hypothetical protein